MHSSSRSSRSSGSSSSGNGPTRTTVAPDRSGHHGGGVRSCCGPTVAGSVRPWAPGWSQRSGSSSCQSRQKNGHPSHWLTITAWRIVRWYARGAARAHPGFDPRPEVAGNGSGRECVGEEGTSATAPAVRATPQRSSTMATPPKPKREQGELFFTLSSPVAPKPKPKPAPKREQLGLFGGVVSVGLALLVPAGVMLLDARARRRGAA